MSKLFDVQSGRIKEPFNVILFGVAGIGKSSWAAHSPRPIFIGGEETNELSIDRFPQPGTYAEFCLQVDHLISAHKDLHYETIVVDTLDSVEVLLHQELLKSDPKQTGSMIAAHGGYGKAYEMAASKLLELRSKFKILRDNLGKNLIFLAHSKKAQAIDPIMGMQYDTYELNLHQKAQSVFVEWVSGVFFANYIVHAQAGTNTDKIFATGDGERVILTEKRPGHLGKNRFSLAYEMPLEFSAFKKAFDEFYDKGHNVINLAAEVGALAQQVVDDKVKLKVFEQIDSAKGDVAKLGKIKDRLVQILQ